MVEALANGAARMDESKLLVFIVGFLDEGRLQCMENHAKRGGGGGSLRVVLIGFTVHVLLENHVRCQGERGLHVFGYADDFDALALADVDNGEQLARFAASGGKYANVTLLQKSRRAVHRLCGGDKARGALDAAHQMRKMLTDDARMAATGCADAGRAFQKVNRLRKGFIVKIFLHRFDAFVFDFIGRLCGQKCFLFHRLSPCLRGEARPRPCAG